MKKSDIAMIVLIASVSALLAFFVGDSLGLLKLNDKGEKVPSATPIVSEVTAPDPKVFNSNAINPTVQTIIGGGQ